MNWTLIDKPDFGAVVMIEWYRWFVGMSLERHGEIRAVIFRLGPISLHIITR